MPTMQIELADLIGSDSEETRNAVIEEAGRVLAGMYFNSTYTDEVKKLAEKAILARVAERIDRIFENSFTETDSYGNPRPGAKPKTPLEIVTDKALAYMHERVNSNGNPASYNDTVQTRLEWLAGKHADELLKSTLAPELKKAADAFKAQIGGKLATIFRDSLTAAMAGK